MSGREAEDEDQYFLVVEKKYDQNVRGGPKQCHYILKLYFGDYQHPDEATDTLYMHETMIRDDFKTKIDEIQYLNDRLAEMIQMKADTEIMQRSKPFDGSGVVFFKAPEAWKEVKNKA